MCGLLQHQLNIIPHTSYDDRTNKYSSTARYGMDNGEEGKQRTENICTSKHSEQIEYSRLATPYVPQLIHRRSPY